MKLIFIFFIFFIIIHDYYVLSDNKRLVIKWILNEKLPSKEEPIELEKSISNSYDSDSSCIWYKLSENKEISDSELTDDYVYKRSTRFCNLLITNFNLTTLDKLDYYEGKSNGTNGHVVYVIAYVKSFEIIKIEKGSYSNEYKCQANITVADVSQFTKNLETLLNEMVTFDTNEVPGDYKASDLRKPYDYDFERKRKRRESITRNVVDYTLSSDTIQVYKGSNSRTLFKCDLKLKDGLEDRIAETKSLFEELEFEETAYDILRNNFSVLTYNFKISTFFIFVLFYKSS